MTDRLLFTRFFFCLSAMTATLTAAAQVRTGISNSNYAGTNGVWMNPSSLADSRVFIDIHIAGLGVFAHNNQVYLPDSRFYDLFKSETYDNVAFTNRNQKRHGFLDASVSGPAVTLSAGRNGFGLHTAVRSYTAINNIPDEWADIMVNGYEYNAQWAGNHDWNNVSAKNLSWAEFGGTYSRIIKTRGDQMFAGGITVKRLIGINSTNISINNYNMTVLDEDNAQHHQLEGSVAWVNNPGWKVGKGWGFDFGFTFKRAIEGETYDHYTPNIGDWKCGHIDYRYKLGVSLLDVGGIKFDQDAQYWTYQRDFDAEDNAETVTLPDSEDPIELAEALITEDNSTTSATEFRAKLPTTASVQFDYNFGNNVYVNATLLQRFSRSGTNGAHRANLLAVTPRYELKNFEAAMPVSLYEYRYPLVGATLRYKFLTVGTDNLWPFAFKNDLYRTDIYFHVKVPIHRSCDSKQARDRERQSSAREGFRSKKRKSKPSKRYLKNKVSKCPTVK